MRIAGKMSLLLGTCLMAILECGDYTTPTATTPADTAGPLFFPTAPQVAPNTPVATALLDAKLVYERGCLWLVSDALPYLAIWPDQSRAEWGDGTWTVIYGSDPVARSGAQIRIGGGEIGGGGGRSSQQAEILVGRLIPDECDNGHFWIAGGVVSD